MKQKLLWEADVSELIQELLKRKSDQGESYFQLEVTQYENQKQKKSNFYFFQNLAFFIFLARFQPIPMPDSNSAQKTTQVVFHAEFESGIGNGWKVDKNMKNDKFWKNLKN